MAFRKAQELIRPAPVAGSRYRGLCLNVVIFCLWGHPPSFDAAMSLAPGTILGVFANFLLQTRLQRLALALTPIVLLVMRPMVYSWR